MNLAFDKMQSLGNDFMVVDGISQSFDMAHWPVTNWADRHYGIGFDQLLVVEPGPDERTFGFTIINADGSRVGQCGNGARCASRFLIEHGLSHHREFVLTTSTTDLSVCVKALDRIEVAMGLPEIQPAFELTFEGQRYTVSPVCLGNPHALVCLPSPMAHPEALVAQIVADTQRFPQGVNVGLMSAENRHTLNLVTYERGAGKTLACGSSASAAVVAGVSQGLLEPVVTVTMPGGALSIHYDVNIGSVLMIGGAERVFSGHIAYTGM